MGTGRSPKPAMDRVRIPHYLPFLTGYRLIWYGACFWSKNSLGSNPSIPTRFICGVRLIGYGTFLPSRNNAGSSPAHRTNFQWSFSLKKAGSFMNFLNSRCEWDYGALPWMTTNLRRIMSDSLFNILRYIQQQTKFYLFMEKNCISYLVTGYNIMAMCLSEEEKKRVRFTLSGPIYDE